MRAIRRPACAAAHSNSTVHSAPAVHVRQVRWVCCAHAQRAAARHRRGGKPVWEAAVVPLGADVGAGAQQHLEARGLQGAAGRADGGGGAGHVAGAAVGGVLAATAGPGWTSSTAHAQAHRRVTCRQPHQHTPQTQHPPGSDPSIAPGRTCRSTRTAPGAARACSRACRPAGEGRQGAGWTGSNQSRRRRLAQRRPRWPPTRCAHLHRVDAHGLGACQPVLPVVGVDAEVVHAAGRWGRRRRGVSGRAGGGRALAAAAAGLPGASAAPRVAPLTCPR